MKKEHSKKLDLYRNILFSNPFSIGILDNELYNLKRIEYSEQFDLRILESIFRSWNDTIESVKANGNIAFEARIWFPRVKLNYEYDSLLYCSEVYTTTSLFKNKKIQEVNIRLPNDGFLYKKHNELKISQDNLKRHRSETWCLLIPDEYKDGCLFLARWFRNFFNLSKDTSISHRVFYNYNEDRVDFKIWYDATDEEYDQYVVIITFEPGYPEDTYGDKDLWKDDWGTEDE